MPMRNNEMLYNVFAYHKNHIEHYGTLGQKWGVRHWQNSDGTFNAEGKLRYFGTPKKSDFNEETLKKLKSEGYARDSYENKSETDNGYLDNVANCMYEDFSYDDSDHKLQTPTQTFKYKTGNCHDQTLFEKELFEQAGLEPKTVFLMEVDPKTGEGGVTHSFVYFEDPNTKSITRFENAWKDRAGVESFSSFNQMKDYMNWEHKNKNGFGNSQTYPELVWGEFKGKPGDDLQDIVNKSLSSKIGTDSFFKDLGLGKKVLSSLVKTKDKAKETAKEIYNNGKTKLLSKYGRNN